MTNMRELIVYILVDPLRLFVADKLSIGAQNTLDYVFHDFTRGFIKVWKMREQANWDLTCPVSVCHIPVIFLKKGTGIQTEKVPSRKPPSNSNQIFVDTLLIVYQPIRASVKP